MKTLHYLHKISTIAAIVGYVLLFAAATQIAVWFTERTPPVVFTGNAEVAAKAGEYVAVKAAISALSASCKSSYSATFTDSEGTMFIVQAAKSSIRSSNGVGYIMVSLPKLAHVGEGYISLKATATCNPIHRLYPVLSEVVVIVEVAS